MKTTWCVASAGLRALGFLSWACAISTFAADFPPLPRLEVSPVIDGDPSEWMDKSLAIACLLPWGTPYYSDERRSPLPSLTDFQATVCYGWDDQAWYMGVAVEDDQSSPPELNEKRDLLNLVVRALVDGDPNKTLGKRVGPVNAGPPLEIGIEGPHEEDGFAGASRRTATGWTMEMKIGWKLFQITPAIGTTLHQLAILQDGDLDAAYGLSKLLADTKQDQVQPQSRIVRLAGPGGSRIPAAVAVRVRNQPQELHVLVKADPRLMPAALRIEIRDRVLYAGQLDRSTSSARIRLEPQIAGLMEHPLRVTVGAQPPIEVKVPHGIGYSLDARDFDRFIGPQVGPVGPDFATFWLDQGVARSQPVIAINGRTATGTDDDALPGIVRYRIDGLRPDTVYPYTVTRPGEQAPTARGEVRTAPQPGSRGKRVIAVTSCMMAQVFPSQPAWTAMLTRKPDLHLLIGDSTYANSVDPTFVRYRFAQQRLVPEMAVFNARIPTWAVWDDHDYGADDVGAEFKGKEASLKLFPRFFSMGTTGTAENPGLFQRFSWGDIDVFLVDVRYYRTNDTILGDAQLRWLFDGLRESQGRVKLIVGGTTLGPDTLKLQRFIAEHRVPGVAVVGGDIHALGFVRLPAVDGCYAVPQIQCSGIAVRKDFPAGLITIDTEADVPSLTFSCHYGVLGEETDRHVVPLSELMYR